MLVPAREGSARASVHHRNFHATGVKRGVAAFSLPRLDAQTVLSGNVTWRGGSRPLGRGRLRAAARRAFALDDGRVPRTARARRPRLIVPTGASQPRAAGASPPTAADRPQEHPGAGSHAARGKLRVELARGSFGG